MSNTIRNLLQRAIDTHGAQIQIFKTVEEMGEQAHWCRGGAFFPTAACTHFVRYDREKTLVRTCLLENVQVF